MAQRITSEKAGQRIYLVGNTFPLKDRIKQLGGHWDGERKQWWLSSRKAKEAEALLAEVNAAESPVHPLGEDADQVRLVGKATYKGRTYYVRALTLDGTRCRLTTLDQSLDFWAGLGDGADQAQIVKRYQPREERGMYGRPTGRMQYTTLGSIQRFLEREKAAEARGDIAP